jgi:hypothetical protein
MRRLSSRVNNVIQIGLLASHYAERPGSDFIIPQVSTAIQEEKANV